MKKQVVVEMEREQLHSQPLNFFSVFYAGKIVKCLFPVVFYFFKRNTTTYFLGTSGTVKIRNLTSLRANGTYTAILIGRYQRLVISWFRSRKVSKISVGNLFGDFCST